MDPEVIEAIRKFLIFSSLYRRVQRFPLCFTVEDRPSTCASLDQTPDDATCTYVAPFSQLFL